MYSLLNFLGLASVPNILPGNEEIATASYTYHDNNTYSSNIKYKSYKQGGEGGGVNLSCEVRVHTQKSSISVIYVHEHLRNIL